MRAYSLVLGFVAFAASIADGQKIDAYGSFMDAIAVPPLPRTSFNLIVKMVAGLNKDKSLAAQKARVKTFVNTTWKELKHASQDAAMKNAIPRVNTWLDARSRQVTYLKALLLKIKPKLSSAIFKKIRSSLWSSDTRSYNVFNAYYADWLASFTSIIKGTDKRADVMSIVTSAKADYERKNPGVWAADAKLMQFTP